MATILAERPWSVDVSFSLSTLGRYAARACLSLRCAAGPFLEPVQWKEWGLVDYPKVVKNPMDLGTVRRKLEGAFYSSPKEFKHDVSLVWINCMTYNAVGTRLHEHADDSSASPPVVGSSDHLSSPHPCMHAYSSLSNSLHSIDRTEASTGTWRRA